MIINFDDDVRSVWHQTFSHSPSFLRVFNYDISNPVIIPKSVEIDLPDLTLLRSSVQILENNSSIPQTKSLNLTDTTTDTSSTAVTKGVKTTTGIKGGLKFSVKLGVLSAETSVEVSLSVEANFSTTTTKTTTKTTTWTANDPITAPPRTRIKATHLIYGGKFTVPLTLNADITGDPNAYDEYLTVSGPYLIAAGKYNNEIGAIPISNMSGKMDNRYRSTDQHGKIVWVGDAITEVDYGLYSTVRIDETPIYANEGESRTYYLPPKYINSN
ncbi:aerolysin family beta-barrel pore-forming toxin (plasmid) [Bacillus mycoides]|uniref:ETX/MTX2 family pore-forming toxin n=1 Tax=Bacillus mycoides TaxID=1405 RepID=UPI001C00E9B7|nr:ETX/MTX2 family pore-forming toxin [Bacillus mycoides]QWH75489.1 aerolysin family beta-barrel pore-forming toxin [Bacillus mycoides]